MDTSPPEVANLPPLPVTGDNNQHFDPATETLFFRPDAQGSFRLKATVSDGESGDDRAIFPGFDALPGWTATGGSDVTGPGPYVSAAYAWSHGAASPGERLVRGRNNAGLQATTTVRITADADEPTGGSIDYPDGYDADGIVTVTTDAGTDALSGLAPGSARLEQGISNLAGGNCPAPAAWTAVTSPERILTGQCARFRYRVSDRVGNEAVYTSPNVVKVDTAAPSALALALDEGSPFAVVAGSQIFVNTTQTGDFDVRATVSDPDSGIARVSFPQRPDDSDAPFGATYSFTDLTGLQTVTASDRAGNSVSAPFTVTRDTQAPTGGSVDYPDGYDNDGNVTVFVANGGDAGAGLAVGSAVLERQTAPLTDGNCSAYGPWVDTTTTNTVATGRCARYRYRISDRVGNEAIYEAPDVVKVDTEAPAKPVLTLVETSPHAAVTGNEIYVNTGQTGSFVVEAATSDTASGIARVRFPDGRNDTTAPYEETYGFTDLVGVVTAAAFDRAGRTASSNFEVIPDTEAPLGASVDYTAGYDADGRVQLTTVNGSDALAGVNSSSGVIERDVVPLAGKTCGTFAGAWEAAGNPDTLAPDTCARYRYRISDRVGNEAVFESQKVVKFDTTLPGNVTGATATAKDHLVQLRWTRPGDADFAKVRVLRSRSGGAAVEVFDGACPTIFCDNTVTNGVTYTYRLVTRDLAGNESAGVQLTATPQSLYLLSPRDGAVVTRPPLLDWRSRTNATYYNVQLWRNGVKILSRHPTRSQFALQSRWAYSGRAYRLTSGRYEWHVWPGFGDPSAARFGKKLGWSAFTKRS